MQKSATNQSAGTVSSTHTISVDKPVAGATLTSTDYSIEGSCDANGDALDLLVSEDGGPLKLIDSVSCSEDNTYSYEYVDTASSGARLLRAAQVDSEGVSHSSSDVRFTMQIATGTPPPPSQPLLSVLSTATKPVAYSSNTKIQPGNVSVGNAVSVTVDFKNSGSTPLTLSKSANNSSVSISGFPATLAAGATARATFAFDTSKAANLSTTYTFHYANSASAKDFLLVFALNVTSPPATNPTNPTDPTTPTTPVNVPAGSLANGINWNISGGISDIDYESLIQGAVKDLGLKSARLYMSVDFSQGASWINSKDKNGASNKDKFAANMKTARLLRAQGVHVDFVVAPPEGDNQTPQTLPPLFAKKKDGSSYKNYEEAKAASAVPTNVCAILTSLYNNGGSSYINMWELGNEVNLGNYWNRGSNDSARVSDYIETYMKPGADCLHALNKNTVVSTAGFTSAVQSSIKLVKDQNGFNYVNIAAIHLYIEKKSKTGVKDVQGYIDTFAAVRANLPNPNFPLAVTEWSGYNGTASGYKDPHDLTNQEASDWADYNDEIWKVIKANASIAHYFAALYTPTAAHGKCSAYQFRNNADGTRAHNSAGYRIFDKTPYFHDSIASW